MIKHSLITWVIIAALALAGCGQKEGQSVNTASTDNYSAKENSTSQDSGRSEASRPKTPPDAGGGSPAQSPAAVTVLSSLPELVAFETIQIKGKTRPGNRIFIEGLEVPLNAGGEFDFPFNLKVGENKINVVTLGKEKTLETTPLKIVRKPLPPRLTVIIPDNSDSENIVMTGQTEKGSIVYIGGNPAKPDKEGNFTASVQLKEGINNIKITSTNKEGGTAEVIKKVTFTAPVPRLEVIIPDESISKQVTISGITDTNTVLVLYVNEVKSSINQQNGVFSSTITLNEGVNSIVITALNKWGETKTVKGNIYYRSQ